MDENLKREIAYVKANLTLPDGTPNPAIKERAVALFKRLQGEPENPGFVFSGEGLLEAGSN